MSLQDAEGHLCGGTIIDATTIVTAAHCTEGFSAGELNVLAGVTDLGSGGGQSAPVANIVDHPEYARTGTADIALLQLAQPLRLDADAQAIEIATPGDLASATTARTSGWGALSEHGDGTNILQEANVPLVDDATCDAQLGIDDRTETCAGGTGTDSCYGDSGGPLVIQAADGAAKLVGVVSWGDVCGGAAPGVYAEVPAFADWIASGGATIGEPVDPSDDSTPADEADWDDGDWDDGDWDDEYWDDEYWDDEYWDDSDWDDGDWDDEYWDDGDWDDGDWDDGDWDDGDWDDGDWDDEYWDDEYWDDEYWDDEYWDDEYWDDEFGACADE